MSRSEGSRPLANLLLRVLPSRERQEVLADLEELRRHHEQRWGRVGAALWFWWELVRFAVALRASGGTQSVLGRPSQPGRADILEPLLRDLRYAVRSLLRTPAVTLVAVPTLALAIGAATAVFSFADALMFRPLEVHEPHSLLSLYHVSTTKAGYSSFFSYPDFADLREAGLPLTGVAAYSDVDVYVGDGARATPVVGQIVSASYFPVLGIQPLLGRTFVPDEDRTPGTHSVVILSEDLWVGRFGRDPAVVGKTVTLNGRSFTVVGVVPRAASSLELESKPLLWVPLMMHQVIVRSFRDFGIDALHSRGTHWLSLVVRMAPGTDVPGARQALEAFANQEARAYPESDGWGIGAVPLARARSGLPGTSLLPRLTGLLAAVVGMVLLIACANVANLLLARATVRTREMGIRVAIGAGRGRLVRQLLTESLVLALAGGAGGVLLAWWAASVLPSLGGTFGLEGLDTRIDVRVLSVALVATLSSGVIFGLVPALRASATDVVRSGSHRSSSPRARPLGQLLVGVQVALSLVLLVGAGLTLRTLWNLNAVPLGFDTASLRIAGLDLSGTGYTGARLEATQNRLLAAARNVPGVRSAALAAISPFSSRRRASDVLWDGGSGNGERNRTNVDMNNVSDGYFATMGILVVAGRGFDAGDVAGSPGSAVVNEALVARLWPGLSPGGALGRRLWSREGTPFTVVGVVADGRYYRSWRTADRPFVFLALSQNPTKSVYLHARGSGPSTPSPTDLREALMAMEPALPTPPTQLASEAQAASVAVERTNARLLSLFGLLAGAISALGIYGVVAFYVSQRTREIGVRMALGAGAPQVRRAVVARSALPIVVGAAAGGLVALALSRFLSDFLYGVGPRDPLTFAAVAALLVGTGLLASLVPARRATRVDPLVALRTD